MRLRIPVTDTSSTRRAIRIAITIASWNSRPSSRWNVSIRWMKCAIRPVSVTRCAVSTSDTITFATGSAEIPMAQARSLRKVADAINKALQKNPAETFLIEGHTDAVGLMKATSFFPTSAPPLSANVLTDVYGIPRKTSRRRVMASAT